MNPSGADADFDLLLVDDHTVVREGLKRILDARGGPWRVHEAGTGSQALECLRSRAYRLAIVDLSMPGISGLDLVRRIKAEFPAVAVLVLSMHAEEQYAVRAFMAGAHGYVTKDSAAEELVCAVQRAADGGSYVTSSLAERVAQHLNGLLQLPGQAELSGHELDVMRRIVTGQRIADIADDLHLPAHAVSTHRRRIFERLQWPSVAALIKTNPESRFDNGELAAGNGPA
ncbi:MAG TPA: response regulator transcription factor [Ideonella sp.]|nr:response regulator transcription factor [Ideonella sp.]